MNNLIVENTISRTLLQNVTGIHPRPNPDSPTFLQSSCLSGKYWLIQEDEAGPLSQCVVTVIFRGAPSIIFMAILMLDVFRGLEQPLVKAPLSFTFTVKLISIFILFMGCFFNTYFWSTMYRNEDYVVVSEESVEILQAAAWLLSGVSLYLGYNRAREQSISLRLYISIESFMSLLLLFLRPKGFKDNVLDNVNRPLYYIVLLDVIRVLSNLLLAFLMGYYPRDVPEYSDIIIHYKDTLLMESRNNSNGGGGSHNTNDIVGLTSSSSSDPISTNNMINYGSTSANRNYSNDINYFSDSTDGEEQFSPTTQENINRINMIKHALKRGSMEFMHDDHHHRNNNNVDSDEMMYNHLLGDTNKMLSSSV